MLSFKVRNDKTLIDGLKKLFQKKVTAGEKILIDQVMKDTDKYVPALTGSLSQRTHVEGRTIVYPGPYARFLYYGKVMIYEPTGSTWAPKYQHKVVTDRDLVMNPTMHALATSHWFEVSKAANLERWLRVAGKAVNYGRK